MRPTTLKDIAVATGGEIIQGDPGVIINRVSTDTRKIKSGDLFLALKGERYDAHQFLEQAARAGAGGLVIGKVLDIPAGVPAVRVNNTLTALQSLAALNRERCGAPLVGVTGSTGKTTTKDMIASVLSIRLRTLKTMGNLNNEIGLPLTLLDMDDVCEAAVIEMGMRGPGEIRALCRIASPTGAVITNIGETHLELLGTVSNIAAAKGEMLEYIPADGFAVLNVESPYIRREARRCRGKVIFFGIDKPCDIMATNITSMSGGNNFTAIMPGDKRDFFLPVPGRHNVMNALAALAVGREFGLSLDEIAGGLSEIALTGMRLEIVHAGDITVINDAYNASPASTKASLQVLMEVAGGRRAVAVLGDMLELGPRALGGHREVGLAAAELGVEYLVAVGDLASSIAGGYSSAGLPVENKIYRCIGNKEAITVLDDILREGDVVLIKGSRGMHMEQIVESLISSRGGAVK
ncbi:MAG: UDP-N-acetylmuramoyl-tripeptide--D-alanyl-D-alanine ligase [Pelotomaculum sp. PtaU1.Bin035]|nr:MAG: UDP-N-acetylmuramoyl-tripeptide--D-alanyl-D-alanine ligase [Pelotomaculum sp. PtaU1.Bin035]